VTDSDRQRGTAVQLVDLSRYVHLPSSSKLILKMDIEGGEDTLLPFILPLLPPACGIFFETHSGETGWRDHESRLRACGFTVERFNARGVYSDGFALRVA
jgi:hypothetical protein